MERSPVRTILASELSGAGVIIWSPPFFTQAQATIIRFIPRQYAERIILRPRVEVIVLALRGNPNEIGVEVSRIRRLGYEEMVVASGDEDFGGFESCGTRETNESLINIAAGAVAICEHIVCVANALYLFFLLFLWRAGFLEIEVTDFLVAGVNLSKLYISGVAWGNDPGDLGRECAFHIDEMLQITIQLL